MASDQWDLGEPTLDVTIGQTGLLDFSGAYAATRGKASNAIRWYVQRRHSKQWARVIRIAAILLITLAGLAPLLQAAFGSTNLVALLPADATTTQVREAVGKGLGHQIDLNQLGYLFAAVAAALIGLDRYLGLTSGWIRYITAELDLRRALLEFEADWAFASISADAGEQKLGTKRLQLIRDFLIRISKIVEDETKLWSAEFQSTLGILEKRSDELQVLTRPSSLVVTLVRPAGASGDFTVEIEGEAPR